MSPKHLQRYLDEFTARRNSRHAGSGLDRLVAAMNGKRLTWRGLTAAIYPEQLALW